MLLHSVASVVSLGVRKTKCPIANPEVVRMIVGDDGRWWRPPDRDNLHGLMQGVDNASKVSSVSLIINCM